MTTALGVSALGVTPLSGTFARATPSVTITSPSATILTTSATLAFTYTSPVSRAQYSYRYQVRSQDGSTVLSDSGTIVSSTSSGITIDYLFAGGSDYQIWVEVSDGYDTSDWAVQSVSCEASTTGSYEVNELVGSVYEIAINGVGYMLADSQDRPVQRQIQQLNPPRLVTGETPYSEAFDRYSFAGQVEWHGGAGQKFRDRSESDLSRFWRSEGIDPFDDGIRLGREFGAASGTARFPITQWEDGYLSATGNALRFNGGTAFTIGFINITDITSGGGYWYVCDGSDIYRNSTATSPGAAWSTIDATVVEWAIDRLAAVYDDGTGFVCVTTLDETGAEEVAGGRFKYEDTATIPSLTAGDGYLWFIVNDGYGDSRIMFWQIGSTDTYAASAFDIPPGEKAVELFFYLGNVFVRVQRSGETVIYRCVPSNGSLTPEVVVEFDETETDTRGFAGSGRFVAFAWSDMVDGKPGIGLIDLSTGGWSTGPYYDDVNAGVMRDLLPLYGQTAPTFYGVSLDGSNRYGMESIPGTYHTVGHVDFSISDLQSGLPKVFDEIQLQFDPLPANTSVAVEYSLDGGNSYTSAGTAVSQTGQTSASYDLGLRGRSIGVRITLTGDGTATPVVTTVQVKLHATSPADQVLVLPINCSDRQAGLNGQELANELTGIGIYRQLEDLVGTIVTLQDTDWPVSGVTTNWELVGVESGLYGHRSAHENRRLESGHAVVTLRKAAT